MTLVGAVGWGCALVVTAGVAAAAAIFRYWVRLAPYARQAHRWLLVGVLALSVTAALTAVCVERASRLVAAVVAVGGTAVVCGFVVAGLIRLPGLPAEPGARVRRLLDGLLAGGCLLFVAWQWLFAPGVGRVDPGRWLVPVAAASILLSLSGGIAVITVWRSRAPGLGAPRVAAVAAALTLIAASGLAVVAALAAESRPLVAFLAFVPLAAGGYLLGRSGRLPAPELAPLISDEMVRLPDEPRRQPPLGAGPALFCVTGMVVQTAVYALAVGNYHPSSGSLGIPLVVLLGARVALALWDARRYAERLGFSEAHFRWMANTDPLTGLANRRRLRQELGQIAPCRTALLALDLDGFKDINDRCGHDVGDAVLIEVGRRLLSTVDAADLVVRLGGDEFAVLLTASQEQAYALAERLLDALCRPYEIGGGLQHVSASIGVATCAEAADPDGMMRNADLALRYAKKRGKSRVELFELAYDRWLQRRIAIERELPAALAADALTVVYQPVVAMATGRVVGAEALIRWHHPTLGPLSPAEFVPIVDEIGLAGQLGSWVRNQACRQLAGWLAAGHNLWVSVNVSVRELRAPDYVPQVLESLREYRLPPAHLVIELAEHDVAQDVDELSYALTALRELGVRIALDDFGAGHSSLGRLRRLAVDILKIDRSLVAEPSRAGGTPAAPLVDVIVRLGERLGLDVIAEGVEDPPQRQVVDRSGCPYGQGYLFGRPLPADRLELLLAPRAIPAQPRPVPTRVNGYSGTFH